MYTDVMIDLETTSTSINAGIFSIGLIFFDLHKMVDGSHTFSDCKMMELFIDQDDCKRLHLHVDENTMAWWSSRPEEVRNHVMNSVPRLSVRDALTRISETCKEYPLTTFWAQGIDFDYGILSNAYSLCDMQPPYGFRQKSDSRTIQKLLPQGLLPKPPKGAHTSLIDCQQQIKILIYVYRYFDLTKCWKI